MTCSSAALNSSARRPWVTNTRPIIENSSRAPLWCTARTRHFDHPEPPRKGVLRESPWILRWDEGGCAVYSVAIVGCIWLPIPFQQWPVWLPDHELSVVVSAAITSGSGEKSDATGIRGTTILSIRVESEPGGGRRAASGAERST